MSPTVENVVSRLQAKRSGAGWVAKCPAHEDRKPSLSIREGRDGRVLLKCFAGCGLDDVLGAAGLTKQDLFSESTHRSNNGKPKPKSSPPFDWQKYVAAFTDRYAKEIAQWRGFTIDFVRELKEKSLIGAYRDQVAFPVHNDGKLVGAHYRPKDGKQWYYTKDVRAAPFMIGAIGDHPNVFESTWDALAFAYMTGKRNGIIVARSASNARLVAALLAECTSWTLWPQSDKANATFQATLLANTKCEIRRVNIPGHHDLNDWTREGATSDDLFEAIRKAETLPRSNKKAERESDTTQARVPRPGDSSVVEPSVTDWFKQKFPGLEAKFGPAVFEEKIKTEYGDKIIVTAVSQPFLAATLGELGRPETPTVFIAEENRFYTYSPSEGIHLQSRPPELLTQVSDLLLLAARDNPKVLTKPLQFGFRNAASLSGVIKHAQGSLIKPLDYFEVNLTEFIPCKNGMLRLSDRELLPFNQSYRRRNKLGVPFDRQAKCKTFLNVLMTPALDPDELDLVQRVCGLFLIGKNLAQRIILLIGTAGGGKGTLIRIVCGILGTLNVAALRTRLLEERFELGGFLGRTLLYGADVPADFLNYHGASILKSLTGGDPVTLEFKGSNERPYIECNFNVMLTCNSRLLVRLEGDTEAWRRRLVPVRYHHEPPKKPIANLSEQILATEASGVLNWMLEGLEKLRADGWLIHLTDAQQKLVDDLLLESDSQTIFVRENLVRDDEGELTVADCYTAYVSFCNDREWLATPRRRFSNVIGDVVAREFGIAPRHDLKAGKGTQRGWKGIRCLNFENESENEDENEGLL
jgi:P4 family phage/plasmid primase-like protien